MTHVRINKTLFKTKIKLTHFFSTVPNRGNLPKDMEAAALMLKDAKQFENLVARTLKGGYINELQKNFLKLK